MKKHLKDTPYARNTHGYHFVYTLECENNVVYIGTTRNLFNRMCNHFSIVPRNRVSAIINNRPIKVLSVYEGAYYEERALSSHLKATSKNINIKGGRSRNTPKEYHKVADSLVEHPALCSALNSFIKELSLKRKDFEISSKQRGTWLEMQRNIADNNPLLFSSAYTN